MSLHSSLKSGNTMKRHRSVLSRLERIRLLEQKGSWDLEGSSAFGLPKVKHLRMKIKKEKAAATGTEAQTAAGTATPSAPGTPSATPGRATAASAEKKAASPAAGKGEAKKSPSAGSKKE